MIQNFIKCLTLIHRFYNLKMNLQIKMKNLQINNKIIIKALI